MKPGDRLVFYEISPRVVDIARREFTFLADTPARIEVILGDGRLLLEREPPRGYDVLGHRRLLRRLHPDASRDARSDGAVREAHQARRHHRVPATNRFIEPPSRREAARRRVRLGAVLVADRPDESEGPAYWYSSTDQIIVTRNARLLAWPRLDEAAEEIEDRPGLPTFTDAHHNLLRILK